MTKILKAHDIPDIHHSSCNQNARVITSGGGIDESDILAGVLQKDTGSNTLSVHHCP